MGKDNRYGPTPHNRFYQPAYYHNPVDAKNGKGKKAKQREHEDKTHWVLKKPEQYHVFLTGDINELFDDLKAVPFNMNGNIDRVLLYKMYKKEN